MSQFLVFFGREPFEVEADRNRNARWKVADLVRDKYDFKCPLEMLIPYLKVHKIPEPDKSDPTGEQLAKDIKGLKYYKERYER